MRTLTLTIYLVVLLVSFPAMAIVGGNENVRTVRNIKILVETSDTELAKKAAVSEAVRQGIIKLVKYYKLPLDVETLSDKTVAEIMLDYTLVEEDVMVNSYAATFDIKYDTSFLLPYTRKLTKAEHKWLVVPVMWQNDGVRRKRADHWWKAWNEVKFSDDALDFTVVSSTDLRKLGQGQLKDHIVMAKLAYQYNAQNILITEANFEVDGFTGQSSIDVNTSKVGRGDDIEFKPINVSSDFGMLSSEELGKAAGKVLAMVYPDVFHARQKGNNSGLKALVPISNYEDWVMLRSSIESAEVVDWVDVNELSTSHAIVTLYSNTENMADMRAGLLRRNIAIYEEVDEGDLPLLTLLSS